MKYYYRIKWSGHSEGYARGSYEKDFEWYSRDFIDALTPRCKTEENAIKTFKKYIKKQNEIDEKHSGYFHSTKFEVYTWEVVKEIVE